MISEIENARRLYGPSVQTMTSNLPDLGESLHNAAIDLSRDCTLDRVDLMLARVKGAETTLVHLRKALIAERGVCGAGTG